MLPGKVKALIECKVGHSPAIKMQEAAQMIAWVKQHPDRNNDANNYIWETPT